MKLEYDWLDCIETKLTLIDKIKMLFLKKQFVRERVGNFVSENTFKYHKNRIYLIKSTTYRIGDDKDEWRRSEKIKRTI